MTCAAHSPPKQPHATYSQSVRSATTCANCGEVGHVYKHCSHPITSYGVICVRRRPDDGAIEYLMVQRRDSLAYVEFLRGKYALEDRAYIAKLLTHMTRAEQARLVAHEFDVLWRWLWQIDDSNSFRREYESACFKFDRLRRGFDGVQLAELVAGCGGGFAETEWGFAKGRRNIGESDYECALREFYEETGMPKSTPLAHLLPPVEEVFIGSNSTRYRHVYYVLGLTADAQQPSPQVQFNSREVSTVAWFDYDAAQARIREYNPERKAMLSAVHAKLGRTAADGSPRRRPAPDACATAPPGTSTGSPAGPRGPPRKSSRPAAAQTP